MEKHHSTTIISQFPLRVLWSFLLLMLFSLFASAAKPPTDEQLKALCREASFKLQEATSKEQALQLFTALTDNLEKQADITKISAQQVDMVFEFGGITLAPYLSRWLAPTLTAKAEKEQGVFAFYAWKYMPRKDDFHIAEEEVIALQRLLNDASLQKVMDQKTDIARDVINGISSFKSANWSTNSFTESASRFLKCDMPATAVAEVVKVFNSIVYAEEIPADQRENIRSLVLAQYTKLAESTDNQRIKKNCTTQIDYLNGPFAKGTLVGSKAPNLHFVRMFKQGADSIEVITDVKDLDQLLSDAEPPVIMLDFWGTKCVPCLQSFPELAELQNHFAGKNVLILGITSLQGYFVDTPNHRTIQCRNNPEKELSLFPAYMKAMEVNWHIGITEEDVMNTDYGALAIPHVVLIDKQGKVRYNALSADKDEKIKLIEELLVE